MQQNMQIIFTESDINQNFGFINLFHFYKKNKHSSVFSLYRTKNTCPLKNKNKNTEWSSLDFPLLGADVQNCGEMKTWLLQLSNTKIFLSPIWHFLIFNFLFCGHFVVFMHQIKFSKHVQIKVQNTEQILVCGKAESGKARYKVRK